MPISARAAAKARSACAMAGSTTSPDQSLGRQIVGVAIVGGPGGAQDFRGGNFLLFAPKLVSAARAAHSAQDTVMDQRLQDRLEMARR